MAQQVSPYLEAAYGWNFGEGGWNSGIDDNLLKFSFLFDRNVDGVVATLPAAVNGKAYFLTTDNRLYFTVNTTYFSCPTPKWFEFVVRGTGVTYQFNGTSAIQVESLIGIDSRLDAVELSVASLGTASSKDVDFFASTSRVDVVEANAQSTTDRAVQVVGDYAAGLVLSNSNQGFRYLGDIYLPGDGITLPYTTTGAGAGEIANFRSVGDAVLRQDLLSNGEPLIGTRDGLLSDTITGLENKIAESEFNDVGLSSAAIGSASSGVVLMIGDSNAEGAGTTGNSFRLGFMGLLNRAIFNADDYGHNRPHGFDFEVLTRLNQGAFLDGCSTNGSFVAAGISDSRVSLAPGQTITFTGRQATSTDVFYIPTLSSGSLIIKLNGVTIKTHAVVTTGTLGTTYPSYPYGPERELAQTDVVTIEASGGTVVVSGIAGWRLSTSGTLVYNAARQGWGFDEFASPARVAEGAAYLNSFYGAETPRSVYIFLGTNNMIGAVSPKSPANYVAALDALIDAYRAAITSTIKNFVVWVPPQPFDALPLGTYTEYAEAIATYCKANGVECIRMDQSIMGTPNALLMADTRHYNDQGHALIARIAANHMGIPARFAPAVRIPTATGRAGVTYLTPVSPWTGTITARITADGVCLLSGIPQQNAAATGHIATLPVNLRPSRDVYLLATTGGIGAVQVVVGADGKITASGVNPISVSLDGLTFDTP